MPELESVEGEADLEVDMICKLLTKYKIENSSSILDFSCGIGRHTIRLARRGFNTVGYDPSEYFIQKAYENARKYLGSRSRKVQFYSGNVDQVKSILRDHGKNKFNAIIIMFNSIGYRSTQHDLRILRDLLELADDDGILIVEMENRDWRTRNFYPFVNYEYDDYKVLESWNFNIETSIARSISNFYLKDTINNTLRLILTLPTHLRLYSLHEFIEILTKSGWVYKESFGSVKTLNPSSLESPDLVTISRKQVMR